MIDCEATPDTVVSSFCDKQFGNTPSRLRLRSVNVKTLIHRKRGKSIIGEAYTIDVYVR